MIASDQRLRATTEGACPGAGDVASEKRLIRRIDVLGAMNLASVAFLTILSPWLAAAAYSGWMTARERPFCEWCVRLAGEANLFRRPAVLASAYLLPLLLSTAIFLAVLLLLKRSQDALTPAVVRRLCGWAFLFGLAALLAIPVMVPDFWLSVAWGRLALQGINPYYSDLTPAALRDLPLSAALAGRMTYGPMWAIISTVIAGLGQGSIWIEFLLFKILLVSAWVGSLQQLRGLLENRSLPVQTAGVCIFGWLPIGFLQVAAEGHNDIVMVFLMVCALRAIQRGTNTSPFFLVASLAVKYVTAPVLLLDWLRAARAGEQRRPYLRMALASAAGGLCVFMIFFRAPVFFEPATRMRQWRFMEPASVIDILLPLVGASAVQFSSMAIRLAFVALAAYYSVRYLRHSGTHNFHHAVLALLAAVLFAGVGHVWPWYVVWVVPVIALVLTTRLATWLLGVAIVFPIVQVWWLFTKLALHYSWTPHSAALLYGLSLAWLLVARRFLPRAGDTPSEEVA